MSKSSQDATTSNSRYALPYTSVFLCQGLGEVGICTYLVIVYAEEWWNNRYHSRKKMQPAANADYGKSIVESDLTSNPAISPQDDDWREIDEAKYRVSADENSCCQHPFLQHHPSCSQETLWEGH